MATIRHQKTRKMRGLGSVLRGRVAAQPPVDCKRWSVDGLGRAENASLLDLDLMGFVSVDWLRGFLFFLTEGVRQYSIAAWRMF